MTSEIEANPLAGNPCPFLRSLVEEGAIEADPEPVRRIGTTSARAFGEPSEQRARSLAISLIAVVGNGLSPAQLFRNSRSELTHIRLRNGPLGKQGVGTRVLDATGNADPADPAELDLAKFYRSI